MSKFLDDLREEIINDNHDMKVLFDYIDKRIEDAVEQKVTDYEYVSAEQVQDMIQKFNDR